LADAGVGGEKQYRRRIAPRLLIDPVDVTWVLSISPTGRRHRSRPGVVDLPGRILEVSITGAQIEGPADLLLPNGARVPVRVRDELSIVTVRRALASDRPGLRLYGVEFNALGPELDAQISGVLGLGRPPEGLWLHAR
jgi:hypothetical protein